MQEKTIFIPDIMVPRDDKGIQRKEESFVRYFHKETGDILEYEEGIWNNKDYEAIFINPILEQNFAFQDALVFEKFHTTERKNTYVTFVSNETGLRYYMFFSEFEKIVDKMIRGVLIGIFSFKKKGEYYSVYMIEE